MSAPGVLAFLHTARPGVEVFRQLVEAIDPTVPTRHELLETVLTDAVSSGVVTDTMRAQTETAVRELVRTGASVVVCTCSTIGGLAEATRVDGDALILRIDRPMAEHAVATGRRIVVAATLPSTLGPTTDLLRQVAADAGRTVDLVERLCADAWAHFERGDRAAYAEAIADDVASFVAPGDTVVLAQASMAPAAASISAVGIQVFASPELGVRAAVEAYRRVERRRTTMPAEKSRGAATTGAL